MCFISDRKTYCFKSMNANLFYFNTEVNKPFKREMSKVDHDKYNEFKVETIYSRRNVMNNTRITIANINRANNI